MALIQAVVSLIVLSILYVRMIKREQPSPIGTAQAVVPIVMGVVSLILSFVFFLLNGALLLRIGYSGEKVSPIVGSVIGAFAAAGLPEEIAKLLMMLLTLLIFRRKIKNVYEYILIGAAVGFGFTLFEEYLYSSDSTLIALTRLPNIAAHMVFGIIMAKHLGQASYNRLTGMGAVGKEYAMAILLPILIHTLVDATNAQNKFLNSTDDSMLTVGIVIGLVGLVSLFILQIRVLVCLKRDTEKYCAMELLPSVAPEES